MSDDLKDAAQSAMEALKQYEAAMAENAVSVIREKEEDKPKVVYRVKGHLFDKAVLNRLLDILVDSSCKFKVSSLDIPHSDEDLSEAEFDLWAEEESDLQGTIRIMDQLVQANALIADTTSTTSAE